jgi:hypothetical protein
MVRCVAACLSALLFTAASHAGEPKKLLLIGQKPDGHPPGTHEYVAGQRLLAKCLEAVPELQARVVQADGPWPEGPKLLLESAGVVLFASEGARWLWADASRRLAFEALAARGGGLVVLHWGMGTREAGPIDPFLTLFGGCHGGPDRQYRVIEDAAVHVTDAEHPVTRGIGDFRARDEFYYRLKFARPPARIQPVLQVQIDGQPETVAWAWERPAGGRSFGFSGLHFHENWERIEYRRLVAQATLWTMRLPIPDKGLAVPLPDRTGSER